MVEDPGTAGSSYDDPYDVAALRDEIVGPEGRWRRLDVVPETGSTNADLAIRARAGEESGAILITDYQSAGRGRQGRTWTAPPGSSIAMSVLIRPEVALERWTWLPLVTGLAVADGLRSAGGVPAELKWPNDVLVGGRKICGILAERVDGPAGPSCVVGMGINVGLRESDLPVPTATSLALLRPELAHPRGAVVAAVLAALDLWLGRWEVRPSAEIAEVYGQRCTTLGKPVEVRLGDQSSATGTAVRFDRDGRLVVATTRGEETFGAGDVLHLR